MTSIKTNAMKWNYAHFPVGTKCMVQVEAIHKEPFEVSITAVIKNGPNSYIIETDQWDEVCGIYKGFNIEHVTSIISRGQGEVKLQGMYDDKWITERVFPKEAENKPKSSYRTTHYSKLVTLLTMRLNNQDHLIDVEKLTHYLIKMGYLKLLVSKSFCFNNYVCVNKKKLNKAIKRNINRFLVKHDAAQKKEYADMNRDIEDAWGRDYDEAHPSMLDEHELQGSAEEIDFA